MGNKEIDCLLTSCGRPDLLMKTLDSFFEFCGPFTFNQFIIYEDSGIAGINDAVKDKYPNLLFIEPKERIGQFKAIDVLYSYAKSEYILFLEEDWTFFKTGFIEKSLDILENNRKVLQVWIRRPNDRNGHRATGGILKTKNGTKYQMLQINYRGVWNGYSQNPGLRRLSDYKLIAPYSQYEKRNSLETEAAVGKQYLRHGFRAATLLDGFVEHSGNNRHCN